MHANNKLIMDKKRQKIIKNAYDKAAKSYADLCFYELYDKPLDKKLYDLFFERIVNKGVSIEIGCGPGEITNYLKMKETQDNTVKGTVCEGPKCDL